MDKFFKRNLSFLSFIFVPLIYMYQFSWLDLLGSQPYWPLFWLLPWSMMHGSTNGFFIGLLFGLALDSIGPDYNFTQIPGLIICGIWFGRLSISNDILLSHLRYGLICSMASFFCGAIYFFQIFIKNFPHNNFFYYLPSVKNIFAQVFITGLFAPLFCSLLWSLFKNTRGSKFLINKSKN